MILMTVIGVLIFVFSTWAVFSHHFCDGIIAKHFLVFAAITALIMMLEPSNMRAATSSVLFLFAGLGYWAYRHRKNIRQRWHTIVE